MHYAVLARELHFLYFLGIPADYREVVRSDGKAKYNYFIIITFFTTDPSSEVILTK